MWAVFLADFIYCRGILLQWEVAVRWKSFQEVQETIINLLELMPLRLSADKLRSIKEIHSEKFT